MRYFWIVMERYEDDPARPVGLYSNKRRAVATCRFRKEEFELDGWDYELFRAEVDWPDRVRPVPEEEWHLDDPSDYEPPDIFIRPGVYLK